MQAAPPELLSQWAQSVADHGLVFHGTGVAVGDAGVLILGPSGSGKSTLALALIALGARLICDDCIWLEDQNLVRPNSATSLVEARGVGLLNAGPIANNVPLHLVVDLERPEPHRLPPRRIATAQGQNVPLILGAGQSTLAPAILQLARHGKFDPDP